MWCRYIAIWQAESKKVSCRLYRRWSRALGSPHWILFYSSQTLCMPGQVIDLSDVHCSQLVSKVLLPIGSILSEHLWNLTIISLGWSTPGNTRSRFPGEVCALGVMMNPHKVRSNVRLHFSLIQHSSPGWSHPSHKNSHYFAASRLSSSPSVSSSRFFSCSFSTSRVTDFSPYVCLFVGCNDNLLKVSKMLLVARLDNVQKSGGQWFPRTWLSMGDTKFHWASSSGDRQLVREYLDIAKLSRRGCPGTFSVLGVARYVRFAETVQLNLPSACFLFDPMNTSLGTRTRVRFHNCRAHEKAGYDDSQENTSRLGSWKFVSIFIGEQPLNPKRRETENESKRRKKRNTDLG